MLFKTGIHNHSWNGNQQCDKYLMLRTRAEGVLSCIQIGEFYMELPDLDLVG
jgi:hypothetical protein